MALNRKSWIKSVLNSRANSNNCTSVNFRTLHVMIQPKRAEIVDILMINFPLLSSHSFFTLSQCNTRNHKHYTPKRKCYANAKRNHYNKMCKITLNIYINRFAYQQVFCCEYKLLFQLYDTVLHPYTHTHRSHRFCHILYFIHDSPNDIIPPNRY